MKTIQQIHLEAIEDSEKLFLKYCSDSNLYQAIKKAFEGRVDKAGVPYIDHCIVVGCYAVEAAKQYQLVNLDHDLLFGGGLCHDVYEDLSYHEAQIVFDAVAKCYWEGCKFTDIEYIDGILTKNEYQTYDQYINRIIDCSLYSTVIKYADTIHNSMISRYDQQKLESIPLHQFYQIMGSCKEYQAVSERLLQHIKQSYTI